MKPSIRKYRGLFVWRSAGRSPCRVSNARSEHCSLSCERGRDTARPPDHAIRRHIGIQKNLPSHSHMPLRPNTDRPKPSLPSKTRREPFRGGSARHPCLARSSWAERTCVFYESTNVELVNAPLRIACPIVRWMNIPPADVSGKTIIKLLVTPHPAYKDPASP
jgi:hypothetical protein